MSLQEYCNLLSEKRKIELSIKLIKIAFPVWEKFCDKGKLSYRDSTAWMKHNVDGNLLKDVIKEFDNISDNLDVLKTTGFNDRIMNLYNKFSDPIIAIQDEDWKLPKPTEKLFYSVYNLLTAIILKDENESGESNYYISINQAIDVIDSEKLISAEEIKLILEEFKK
jgi:hypothetical protein